MTSAERALAWRLAKKAAGRCTCCGHINDALPRVKCLACLFGIRAEANQANRSLKSETINAYGGKCSAVRTTGECPERDLDILEIDHIAGGGNKQRKESGLRGVNFYRSLRRDGWPVGYRVLCRNCNWLAHLGRLVK